MLTTFSQPMDVEKYMNNTRVQNSREYDENVFEPFHQALKDPVKKKFIVLHLLGTHMKYDYRYPESFEKFKGSEGLKHPFDKSQLFFVNSYDNAVLYNDFIVSELIKMTKKDGGRSLLVYFSDHGEDVYDSPPHQMLGRNEGRPTSPMYTIPFIVWKSDQWKVSDQRDLKQFVERPYSNSHFIYTWADLTGLTFKDFDATKSIINPSFKERPLLVGDPSNKANLKALVQ